MQETHLARVGESLKVSPGSGGRHEGSPRSCRCLKCSFHRVSVQQTHLAWVGAWKSHLDLVSALYPLGGVEVELAVSERGRGPGDGHQRVGRHVVTAFASQQQRSVAELISLVWVQAELGECVRQHAN